MMVHLAALARVAFNNIMMRSSDAHNATIFVSAVVLRDTDQLFPYTAVYNLMLSLGQENSKAVGSKVTRM